MAFRATFRCDQHADLQQCSEAAVIYDERWDEYSLGARGGTGDEYIIYHCPWCGVRLPESKRDLWFESLEAAGIDPIEDEVPKEYKSSAWRKKLGQ